MLSRLTQEAGPNVPYHLSIKAAIPEGKSATTDDEDLPVTSESETSSNSSSGDAYE